MRRRPEEHRRKHALRRCVKEHHPEVTPKSTASSLGETHRHAPRLFKRSRKQQDASTPVRVDGFANLHRFENVIHGKLQSVPPLPKKSSSSNSSTRPRVARVVRSRSVNGPAKEPLFREMICVIGISRMGHAKAYHDFEQGARLVLYHGFFFPAVICKCSC